MKKLSLINKIIYVLNAFVAVLLLFGYALPYVPPRTFAMLSVLSLAVPVLILGNVLFLIYWLIKRKKQLLLSLLVLLIGLKHLGNLYKISSDGPADDANLSIMSFNVRLFNKYKWLADKEIPEKFNCFIKTHEPDIICLQEYEPNEKIDLGQYPHCFAQLSGAKNQYGQIILSKFKIINTGSIDFPDTANNAIFADLIIGEDTLRIYNIHLQSSGINPQPKNINAEESERLIKRIAKTFGKQQEQMEKVVAHQQNSPYKMLVCGDFNNTAYSYVYRKIKRQLNDAFQEAGSGFGKTLDFKFFPVRIDFILTEPQFEVRRLVTFDEKMSDHFPIMAHINLKSSKNQKTQTLSIAESEGLHGTGGPK